MHFYPTNAQDNSFSFCVQLCDEAKSIFVTEIFLDLCTEQ